MSALRRPAAWVVAILHVAGWGMLLLLVLPAHVRVGSGPTETVFGIGLGATAYALGLRHAFDADHIAAIDNTTKRLLDRGRPAGSVGLWFSLGHSTIVVVLCVLLALGLRTIGAALADSHSGLHVWTGTIGPVVSGVFLLTIAVLNASGLRRRRAHHSHDLEHVRGGGPVAALLRRTGAVVDRPSRMYGVGLLFGLGFDTASEVGLLALAGAASVGAVPWWAVLTLPVLFAAGMSFLDSAQGAMSRRAYGWRARSGPSSARGYDVVVTGVSVVAAVAIGVVELAGVGVDRAPHALRWLAPIADVDLDRMGFVLTGVLLATWLVAAVTLARRPRGDGTGGTPQRASAAGVAARLASSPSRSAVGEPGSAP